MCDKICEAPSGRLALGIGIRRENPGKLSGRRLEHAGDPRRGGGDEPQQLGPQAVQRRQFGERLDAGCIEHLAAEGAAIPSVAAGVVCPNPMP